MKDPADGNISNPPPSFSRLKLGLVYQMNFDQTIQKLSLGIRLARISNPCWPRVKAWLLVLGQNIPLGSELLLQSCRLGEQVSDYGLAPCLRPRQSAWLGNCFLGFAWLEFKLVLCQGLAPCLRSEHSAWLGIHF